MKNFKRLYESRQQPPRRGHRPQAPQDDAVAQGEGAAEGVTHVTRVYATRNGSGPRNLRGPLRFVRVRKDGAARCGRGPLKL